MSTFSKRPPLLKHLSDEAAARALSRHFGDFVKAAKELGVDRRALRRLTWSNPAILDAAHERMAMVVERVWDEAVRGLDSKRASVRERAVDRMFAHPRMIGHPFAPALSVFARAPRARGPRSSDVFINAERARAAVDRELAAERDMELVAERERETAAERALEQERAEVMVERRPSAPPVAPTASLWPAHIRRPTRGRRW
jgi:hypothetical protein